MMRPLIFALTTRVRRWARRRQGEDHAPVTLERRRIYILPSGFGLIYALIVFAMLLGSMNYNNSLGFALTFLLASLGLIAMHHCHRNLAGIIVSGVQAGEAFAGEPLKLQVGVENASALARLELEVDGVVDGAERPARSALLHHLPAGGRALASIEVPTERRGVLRVDRLVLATRFPFGLFRAWSWVHLPVEALVYPHPRGDESPPADATGRRGAHDTRQRGAEEFRGFRGYVPGDSPRHIAWKALARGAPLLVKDYAGADRAPVMLDFDAVLARDTEARLAQLCRWVMEADRGAQVFGLRLPGVALRPRAGPAQRRRCLEALARFDSAHVARR